MADNSNIAWREPELFAAGDTLLFQRYLPDYLPANGWFIKYTLTNPNTGLAAATFNTVVNPVDATAHLANVAAFARALAPGDYLLVGRVQNTSNAITEQHQVYYGALTLQPDLADGGATAPVLTEAQEMITLLRDTLKQLYALQFAETEVQRNRFKLQDQQKVLEDLKYWKEVRFNEIAQERVRNGQASGMISVPVFSIG
jgi:hypothetical protein